MRLDFLNKREALDSADLEDCEQVAYQGHTAVHRALQRLLIEVRDLWKELQDPNYQYAGGRVPRAAIVCRNAEITALQKEIQDYKDQVVKELESRNEQEKRLEATIKELRAQLRRDL